LWGPVYDCETCDEKTGFENVVYGPRYEVRESGDRDSEFVEGVEGLSCFEGEDVFLRVWVGEMD
jgi:hypothetical protein